MQGLKTFIQIEILLRKKKKKNPIKEGDLPLWWTIKSR